MLAKQYEMARLEEAKDSSVVQVLDQAVPAERKFKPKRALITLGGILGGGFLAVLLALIKEAYSRSRRDPNNTWRWKQASEAWKL